MIIVGELINASRKAMGAAIKAQDVEYIQKIAKEEFEAGANYIDVNAGIFVGKETRILTMAGQNGSRGGGRSLLY